LLAGTWWERVEVGGVGVWRWRVDRRDSGR
jgi:hypothetical protein